MWQSLPSYTRDLWWCRSGGVDPYLPYLGYSRQERLCRGCAAVWTMPRMCRLYGGHKRWWQREGLWANPAKVRAGPGTEPGQGWKGPGLESRSCTHLHGGLKLWAVLQAQTQGAERGLPGGAGRSRRVANRAVSGPAHLVSARQWEGLPWALSQAVRNLSTLAEFIPGGAWHRHKTLTHNSLTGPICALTSSRPLSRSCQWERWVPQDQLPYELCAFPWKHWDTLEVFS